MYILCMYVQHQQPMRAEGPKECPTMHSSYGTVFSMEVYIHVHFSADQHLLETTGER